MEDLEKGILKFPGDYDVTSWFRDQQRNLMDKKNPYFMVRDRFNTIFLLWIFPNLFLAVCAGIVASSGKLTGVGFIITALVGLLGSAITTFILKRKEKIKCQRVEKEFYLDTQWGTLRKRAELLIPTLLDYHYHRDCYRQLYGLIEKKIIKKEPEEMERYASFIKHADTVLTAAVNNFLAVLEHTKREIKYREEQSQRGIHGGSSLVLLLETIDADNAHLNPQELFKPLTTLQHEEAILEIVSELKASAVQTPVSA